MLRIIMILFVALSNMALNWCDKAITREIGESNEVGSAAYYYFFMHIYDGYLYAPGGEYKDSKPFALKLTYRRNLKGKDIADRTRKEMTSVGLLDKAKLDYWHSKLVEIFPDVKNGDSLVGIYCENGITRFYNKGKFIGELTDPEFGKWFFGIWLSEETSDRSFRKKLLGQ